MPNIDNLGNDPCVSSFLNMNQEIRATLDQLSREGQVGLQPARPGSKQNAYIESLYEIYVNGLLSNPKTVMINAVSNTVPVGTRILDTLAAASFSRLQFHGVDKVYFREAIAEAQGIVDGAIDAFRFVNAVLKNPTTALESVLQAQAIPVQLAEQAKVERTRRVITGQNIDNVVLKHATEWLGRSINIPGSFLTTTDLFYKIIHHRAEVSKQAMRRAIDEGHSGVALHQKYNEIRDSVFSGSGAHADIDDMGMASADLRTFTNRPEGPLNQWMAGAQDKGFIRWIVPFRRTMVNLFNYGVDSSPLGLVKGFTDKLGVTNTKTGRALLAGGAARSEALGRMAVGTMLTSAIVGIMGSDVDGQAPRNDQDKAHWHMNGHKEYTWRVGDRHIPLDSFGQFAPMLKAITDVGQGMAQISYDNDPDADDRVQTMAGALLVEMSEQMLNTHWVSSLGPFVEALNRFKNDEKNSTEPLQVFAGRMISNMVPFSSAVKTANREFSDPYIHDLRGLRDDIFAATKANIVGLSDSLPRKVDLWGNYIRYDAWQNPDLEDPISGKDEVYEAIKAVGTHIPISRRTKHGVNMTPEEFERFMVLSGTGVNNMPPLRDKLQATMNTAAYKSFLHDSARAEMLEDVIQTYREAASDFMAVYDKDFRSRIEQFQLEQKEKFRRAQ